MGSYEQGHGKVSTILRFPHNLGSRHLDFFPPKLAYLESNSSGNFFCSKITIGMCLHKEQFSENPKNDPEHCIPKGLILGGISTKFNDSHAFPGV